MKHISLYALVISLVAQVSLFGSDCEVSCFKAPSVVKYAQPQLPEGAIKPGETAEIVLRCAINEQGELVGTKTLSSSHPDIEAAVIAAVQNWTFAASVEQGETQRATINIPFKFTVAAK